jgi:hypothetical protein
MPKKPMPKKPMPKKPMPKTPPAAEIDDTRWTVPAGWGNPDQMSLPKKRKK